jgi:hypothetical protein
LGGIFTNLTQFQSFQLPNGGMVHK